MTIDSSKVRNFWDQQASKIGGLDSSAVANLEEDTELQQLKVAAERVKLQKIIQPKGNETVLDLGAGTGQWSFFLAPQVEKVTAVEYSRPMFEIALKLGNDGGHENVEFVNCSAQEFSSSKKFDLIIASGLFIYLNDDDYHEALKVCRDSAKPNARLLVRDATGLGSRYQLNSKYSEELSAEYSAIYRTREEYIASIESFGFKLLCEDDMFPNHSVLNKRKETRLRVYLFELVS